MLRIYEGLNGGYSVFSNQLSFWPILSNQLRGYDTLANVRKKRIKMPFWGREVSLICCFSTDKTLGTEYDIHLLCTMIADHVTLPAISLLHFWAAGCS